MINFSRLLRIVIIFLFCANIYGGDVSVYSKHEVIADRLTGDVAKELSKLYNIKAIGFGGMMHEDVEEMALSFYCYREMSRDEYRKLIIDCSEYYLNKINSSEDLRPHLHNVPFDANNIHLCIYVFSKDRNRFNVGQLSSISVVKGKVRYTIRETEFTVKTTHKESYEEALQIVREQRK